MKDYKDNTVLCTICWAITDYYAKDPHKRWHEKLESAETGEVKEPPVEKCAGFIVIDSDYLAKCERTGVHYHHSGHSSAEQVLIWR